MMWTPSKDQKNDPIAAAIAPVRIGREATIRPHRKAGASMTRKWMGVAMNANQAGSIGVGSAQHGTANASSIAEKKYAANCPSAAMARGITELARGMCALTYQGNRRRAAGAKRCRRGVRVDRDVRRHSQQTLRVLLAS